MRAGMDRGPPMNAVMLATPDEDLTLCDADAMAEVGQQAANTLGCTVTARDPISDEVLATFEPAAFTRDACVIDPIHA
jgi:hypothetical protein